MLTGTARSDPAGNSMPAALGSWIHHGALQALRRQYGALVEVKVGNATLRGSADAVYLDAVEELKTRSRFRFHDVLNAQQPSLAELYQVHLYAWMLRQGQITDRRLAGTALPIEWVRLRYVCRDTGQEWLHSQRYDPQLAAAAIGWVDEVLAVAAGPDGPEALPRDEPGPGLSVVCDGCPFRSRCWGPVRTDGRRVQANLLRSDEQIAQALEDYGRLRELDQQLTAARAFNRALLDASSAGVYGGWQLSWSGEQPAVGAKVDVPAMLEAFARAGWTVPYLPPGPSRRSIQVRRAVDGRASRASPT